MKRRASRETRREWTRRSNRLRSRCRRFLPSNPFPRFVPPATSPFSLLLSSPTPRRHRPHRCTHCSMHHCQTCRNSQVRQRDVECGFEENSKGEGGRELSGGRGGGEENLCGKMSAGEGKKIEKMEEDAPSQSQQRQPPPSSRPFRRPSAAPAHHDGAL